MQGGLSPQEQTFVKISKLPEGNRENAASTFGDALNTEVAFVFTFVLSNPILNSMIHSKAFLVAVSLLFTFEAAVEAQLFRKGNSRQSCCSCPNAEVQQPVIQAPTVECSNCSQPIQMAPAEHYIDESTQPVVYEYDSPLSVSFPESVEYASPQLHPVEVQPSVIATSNEFQVYEELPSSPAVGGSGTFSHVESASFEDPQESPTAEAGAVLASETSEIAASVVTDTSPTPTATETITVAPVAIDEPAPAEAPSASSNETAEDTEEVFTETTGGFADLESSEE